MIRISTALDMVWRISAHEAAYAKHQHIDPEHLFIGVCSLKKVLKPELLNSLRLSEDDINELHTEEHTLSELFKQFGLNEVELRREMRKRKGRGDFEHTEKVIHRSEESREIFRQAEKLASEAESEVIGVRYFLAALLEQPDGTVATLLREKGVDIPKFQEEAIQMTEIPVKEPPGGNGSQRKTTPFLNRFGADLVQKAQDGQIHPVTGDKIRREMLQVVRVMAQATKNNPVLVGEPGVGKTAVVEGLAGRIAENRIPDVLKGCRIIQLNMGDLVAGTKYRGEFEERLQGILHEASQIKDIILFIDEIHTVIGAGAAGNALDAANIMKPALSRGDIRIIGATTLNEYRKYIEKDPALERRFQPITINEPSEKETVEILKGIKNRFEEHHNATIADDALSAAVDLSAKHLHDRRLPDKAIDLLDKACAEKTVQWGSFIPGEDMPQDEGGVVTAESVAQVISRMTGIPVAQLKEEERERLLAMGEKLKERVIGQDEACEKVASAVQRGRAGLKQTGRPLATFLFLGPTGVGKTELAKATADFLFGSEQAMIRLDMSEFMEKHTVARLIGAPPGYVGYDEEGQLTGALRRTPYCVVLLDEVEKAHPQVLDLFLQLFDEGRLTDSRGRTVDAGNALFVMTSNIRFENEPSIGFRTRGSVMRGELQKQGIRPELLNRIDEIILFRKLAQEDTGKIVTLMLNDLERRLQQQEIDSLDVRKPALDLLCREGYDEQFGARNLRRVIEQRVENEIAGRILRGEIMAGHIVIVDAHNDRIIIDIDSPETIA